MLLVCELHFKELFKGLSGVSLIYLPESLLQRRPKNESVLSITSV